jgi:hypothetical protein
MQPTSKTLTRFLLCTFIGFTALAVAQDKPSIQVIMRRAPYAIDDPVRITEFKLDGQVYDFTKGRNSDPVQTMSGWLQRLQFTVHNFSQKNIVAGIIQVTCPAMGNGHTLQERRVLDQFVLGVVPDRFGNSGRNEVAPSAKSHPPISIGPNGEMSFVLQNDFSRMQKQILESDPTPDCAVDPRAFFFSDGTMWSPRHFYKPDPNSDHGYVSMTAHEFGIDVPTMYRY